MMLQLCIIRLEHFIFDNLWKLFVLEYNLSSKCVYLLEYNFFKYTRCVYNTPPPKPTPHPSPDMNSHITLQFRLFDSIRLDTVINYETSKTENGIEVIAIIVKVKFGKIL